VWSAPIWYLGRRGYQVVRTTRPAGRARTPEGPAREARIIQAQRPVSGARAVPAE